MSKPINEPRAGTRDDSSRNDPFRVSCEPEAGGSRVQENQHRQPLRLVVSNDDFRSRKYAQSTSGLVSSTDTAPPLSRSSAIASASRTRTLSEMTLRRYPSDVPQRSAYASCSGTGRELRYERSDSMAASLPSGTNQSRPAGNLPGGKRGYAIQVGVESQNAVFSARRERLRQLIASHGTSRSQFIRNLGQRLVDHPELADSLKAYQDASYLSRLLTVKQGKPRKNVGEEPARALEIIFDKPAGWMSTLATRIEPWPFGFSRAVWDDLNDAEKRAAEQFLLTYITGLRAERHPSHPRRRAG